MQARGKEENVNNFIHVANSANDRTLLMLPFYDLRWPLDCCLNVMLIILIIIIQHQWVHTGSIWKCLIFWWWHKVSTNALGLLWLTLTRNNLCRKREQGDVKRKKTRDTKTLFLSFYSHSLDRKTYPSTCPCWWMMRWDSSLVILPWNHSWAIWMTAEKSDRFEWNL